MRIFLISPLTPTGGRDMLRFPPLGIAYLAAALIKNGDTVKLWDRNIVSIKNKFDLLITDNKTLNEIKNFNPDVVGFSVTTPTMYDVKYFSEIIRDVMPHKKIIIGGIHPTVEPEESLRICPAVDVVVRGEGEQTIVNLVNSLDSYSEVKGITFRMGEEIISNSDVELIANLDDIPPPRRELLDMNFYSVSIHARGLYGRFTTIFTSRGCFNRCNFCSGHNIFKKGVRFHSANRIASEIEDITGKYKIDYLWFAEDEFLSHRERIIEFSNLLIKKGLNKKVKWIGQVRPDKNRVDEELLKIIKESGCIQLEFGFESASQEELDRMNKNTQAEDYHSLVKLTQKNGIRCQANIILNYPGQTREDFLKTLFFIKNSKPQMIQANRFLPLPGSQIYEDLKKRGYRISWKESEKSDLNFSAMSDKEYMEISHFFCLLCEKINKKNFHLFYLFNKPLFFLQFVLKLILKRILRKIKYYARINQPVCKNLC